MAKKRSIETIILNKNVFAISIPSRSCLHPSLFAIYFIQIIWRKLNIAQCSVAGIFLRFSPSPIGSLPRWVASTLVEKGERVPVPRTVFSVWWF